MTRSLRISQCEPGLLDGFDRIDRQDSDRGALCAPRLGRCFDPVSEGNGDLARGNQLELAGTEEHVRMLARLSLERSGPTTRALEPSTIDHREHDGGRDRTALPGLWPSWRRKDDALASDHRGYGRSSSLAG